MSLEGGREGRGVGGEGEGRGRGGEGRGGEGRGGEGRGGLLEAGVHTSLSIPVKLPLLTIYLRILLP